MKLSSPVSLLPSFPQVSPLALLWLLVTRLRARGHWREADAEDLHAGLLFFSFFDVGVCFRDRMEFMHGWSIDQCLHSDGVLNH